MVDDAHEDYWGEALSGAFERADAYSALSGLTPEQRAEIARSLALAAETQSYAFHEPDPPPNFEAERLRQRLAEQETVTIREHRLAMEALGRRLGVDPDSLALGEHGEVLYTGGNGLPYQIA